MTARLCVKCKKQFEPALRTQRFCTAQCRINYNNEKKKNGIRLVPRVLYLLEQLAEAHGIPIDEMANMVLARALHPDGQPLMEEEIYGK